MTDDRDICDDLADGFSEEERAELEAAESDMRRRATPVAMTINVGKSLIIDHRGLFDDAEISGMETRHAQAQREYREEFGGRARSHPDV